MKFRYLSYMCCLGLLFNQANAYTPLTWINKNPQELFLDSLSFQRPTEQEDQTLPADWKKENAATFFTSINRSLDGTRYQAGGIALEGHLKLGPIVSGLYANIYVPVAMVHTKEPTQNHDTLVVGIPDGTLLLGWNAIKKQDFNCSLYLFGVTPVTDNKVFYHRNSFVGFNSHQRLSSWGFGGDAALRLMKKKRYEVSWLNEANVRFDQASNEFYVGSDNEQKTSVITLLKINPNQLYHARSWLAFTMDNGEVFHHLGVRYLFSPKEMYTTLNEDSGMLARSQNAWKLFYYVECTKKNYKVPLFFSFNLEHSFVGRSYGCLFKVGTKF